MVGRGPYQVQHPINLGDNNTYSNQLPSKVETYDIQPVVKQETTITADCSSKFANYFGWAGGSYTQEVPQYPVENGIFLSPVEEVGNNPYKQLEQREQGNVSFQKHPLYQDEHNWPISREGAGYLSPPSMVFDKKEKAISEDDVLAQLFMSDFMNDDNSSYDIPLASNDMLIPVQTPSPASSTVEPMNQIQTHYPSALEPSHYSPVSTENAYYNNGGNNVIAASPDNNGVDPLVSVFNEGTSPPNNDFYPPMSQTNGVSNNNMDKSPNDDWQMILNQILSVENLPMENNGLPVPTQSDKILLPAMEEENNEIQNTELSEDMLIPYDAFQFPPPSKKRLSESSNSSGNASCMEESPPPSVPSSHTESHPSPTDPFSSPHPPEMQSDKPSPKTPSLKPRASTANLFGQKEDEIIDKLLIPKPGSANKPITRDKLVTMNVEDFNALLDQAELTEIEVAFMKEWRRRGKNKMAAQIARKRKRDELSELQDEIDLLRRQKAQLKQQSNGLKASVNSFKKRAQAAEERIYRKYSTAHGSIVSRDTHNIHVTDDGKTMLVPRTSSQQVLLV